MAKIAETWVAAQAVQPRTGANDRGRWYDSRAAAYPATVQGVGGARRLGLKVVREADLP